MDDQLPRLPHARSETSPKDQDVQPTLDLAVQERPDGRPAQFLLDRLATFRLDPSALA